MKEKHFSLDDGLALMDAIEKLEKAGLSPPQFTKRYLHTIRTVSDEVTRKSEAMAKVSAEKREELWSEIEEVNLTLRELNRVFNCVYEVFRGDAPSLSRPADHAWAIYHQCLRNNKKELMQFAFGLRVGYAFGLMYGHSEQSDGERRQKS